MTREEAIKYLEDLHDNYYWVLPHNGGWAGFEHYRAFDMALDALRRTAWRSVEDTLPNLLDDVLVMLSNGSMIVDYTWEYEPGQIKWGEHDCRVIAWQPLPEPYREGFE